MKKLVALLLTLAMLLSVSVLMTACKDGDDKDDKTSQSDDDEGSKSKNTEPTKPPKKELSEAIIGTWKGTIDMTEYMKEYMANGGQPIDFEISDLTFSLIIKFTDDGKGEMVADEDSIKELEEKLLDITTEMFKQNLQKSLDQNGINMTPDEYCLQELGMTCREYAAKQSPDLEKSFESKDGLYKLDGNKLYMYNEEDGIDESKYMEISIDDDELTIIKLYPEDERNELLEGVTLKRQ